MKKHSLLIYLLFFTLIAGCSSTQQMKSPGPQPVGIRQEAAAPAPSLSDNDTAMSAEEQEGAETTGAELFEDTRARPRFGDKTEKLGKTIITRTPAGAGQKISLNFDNADIYEVINALSEILGINYVIDPSVKGRVNIHTSGEIEKSQLLSILETVFEMNNVAMVKFGDLYKIVPVKESKMEILDIYIGRTLRVVQSLDRVIIQVVPLRYVSSSEVAKMLKSFVGKGADIVDYTTGNFLIIVESAANIAKLLKLVSLVDVDIFEHTSIRLLKIENAAVGDIAKELESIFGSMGIGKSTEKGIGLKFIAIERISSILAISTIPGIFEKVRHWLDVLDAVDVEAEEQIFIYFVENGKAEEIADVLKKVYGEGVTEKKTTRKTPASKKTTKTTAKKTTGGLTFIQGKIKIVTDETTNSIIVRATPHDYAVINKTIQKLDIIPKQVLIEVLIAEVTLGGDTAFGVEWALLGDYAKLGAYKGTDAMQLDFGLANDAGPGFTYSFNSNRLNAFLHAQASQNKLNVLSSPHILAADNKQARIEVGEEVPIITSEYVPAEVETNTSTSRSIEYRSTGVILTVTPRINEKGLVAMDIMQEVSEAQPVVTGGIQSPVISNRKAETSLVCQDNETIIIGGMIKDRVSKTVSSVPFLAKIPLLSYLFSDTQDQNDKTELILLITPHVVHTISQADMVTREFERKLANIKRVIRKSDQKWGGFDQ